MFITGLLGTLPVKVTFPVTVPPRPALGGIACGSTETGIPARIAARPFDSAVLGTAAYLTEMGSWSRAARREAATR